MADVPAGHGGEETPGGRWTGLRPGGRQRGKELGEEEGKGGGKEGGREGGEDGGKDVARKYPLQPPGASLPFMVTRDMRRALIEDMNYSRKEVDRMKPEQAWAVIQSGVKKAPKPRRLAPYPPLDLAPVLDREEEGGEEGGKEGEVIEVSSSSA
ncbi:hypothetical protein Naga_100710g3 [Nannochloropsis gaditana]|uniref:Uncharacterized protein n=1 Tax=Nannochloropsis gaditana TaxID=72520 RepID=W7TMY8_9STRA|nr:hypothetical protein Naga_100710g3 [Nannochloropsis gaditana]